MLASLLGYVLFLLSISYIVKPTDRDALARNYDALSSLHISTCLCSSSAPELDVCLVNGHYLLDHNPHTHIQEWELQNTLIPTFVHAKRRGVITCISSHHARSKAFVYHVVEGCRALLPDHQLELGVVQQAVLCYLESQGTRYSYVCQYY